MTGPPPRATPRLEGRTRNGLGTLRAPAPPTVPGLKNALQADLGFCPGTGALLEAPAGESLLRVAKTLFGSQLQAVVW